MVTKNRTISLEEIQCALLQAEIEVSIVTIQRVLKDAGFHSKVVKKVKYM